MSMLSTDPIADMLSRIRNAALVGKRQITLPHSKVKQTIAEQLQKAGYLTSVKVIEARPQSTLEIIINDEGNNTVITEIARISKPGRRVYAKSDEIPRIKNGRGIVLISTSRGVMTGQAAKKQKLGGELICKVY
jgi:small subunit ribosomal protein S8